MQSEPHSSCCFAVLTCSTALELPYLPPTLLRCHSRNALIKCAGGLTAVLVPGVENVNLSRYVHGHADYLDMMDDLLEILNLREGD